MLNYAFADNIRKLKKIITQYFLELKFTLFELCHRQIELHKFEKARQSDAEDYPFAKALLISPSDYFRGNCALRRNNTWKVSQLN